jgi:hypothetical protein
MVLEKKDSRERVIIRFTSPMMHTQAGDAASHTRVVVADDEGDAAETAREMTMLRAELQDLLFLWVMCCFRRCIWRHPNKKPAWPASITFSRKGSGAPPFWVRTLGFDLPHPKGALEGRRTTYRKGFTPTTEWTRVTLVYNLERLPSGPFLVH